MLYKSLCDSNFFCFLFVYARREHRDRNSILYLSKQTSEWRSLLLAPSSLILQGDWRRCVRASPYLFPNECSEDILDFESKILRPEPKAPEGRKIESTKHMNSMAGCCKRSPLSRTKTSTWLETHPSSGANLPHKYDLTPLTITPLSCPSVMNVQPSPSSLEKGRVAKDKSVLEAPGRAPSIE